MNAADWLTAALLFVVLGYLALTLLAGTEAKIEDALEMDDSGDEEAAWWGDTLALLRDGMAMLAPAAGEATGMASTERRAGAGAKEGE